MGQLTLAPIVATAAATVILFAATLRAQETGEQMIKEGSVVSFEYTLSNEDGKVIESNKGKDPLTYKHGEGQIIPGLEKELTGMKVGEEKNVRVKSEEGYGAVDPQAFREIQSDQIPAEALKVGTTLYARNAQGQTFPVRVHEIKENAVTLDFNHPLAGKALRFDVKITAIKSAETR
jgi:FKBP-type peptidyl-prolyl cis-trans isomerase 2